MTNSISPCSLAFLIFNRNAPHDLARWALSDERNYFMGSLEMTTMLHIDSSARRNSSVETPYGSHSRRLTERFVRKWREAHMHDSAIIYRDVGQKPPAQFKAWIDNIIRVGRTFGFDRSRTGDPYWPLLSQAGKTLVILSSRGDHGYGRGGRIEQLNHVEPSISTAFTYIGVTDLRSVAVEFDEFADERLRASIKNAEAKVDALVETLVSEFQSRNAA
jgi:FMN-dependent NADH-azoreductase